jgi:hypothetical protein
LAKLNFGDEDESDLLAKIQQLRNELVTNFVRNDQIEKEQKTLEFLVWPFDIVYSYLFVYLFL